MSNSRKDNHKWKRKERKRTGKSDPKKIKLHRKRVIKRPKQTNRPVDQRPQHPRGGK